MRSNYRLVAAVWLLVAPITAAASPTDPWSVQDCVRFALAHNPEIQGARYLAQASQHRITLAATPPQPSLDLDYDLQPHAFRLSEAGESYVGLSTAIDFPLKTIVRRDIARRERDETAAEAERVVLDTVFHTREAFYLLLLAQNLQTLAQENLGLTQEFLAKTESRVQAGEAARVEVLRAQVEVTRAMLALKLAADRQRTALVGLNQVMGRRDKAPLNVCGDFDRTSIGKPLQDHLERARGARPELQQAAFAVERERLRQKEGRLGFLPDLNLGVARHRITGAPSSWDVTLSATLPLFFWQPTAAAREATANRLAREKDLEHLESTVRQEVEEAFIQAESAWRQVQLFESDILVQSRDIHALFLESYHEGEIAGIELIEARRSLNEVNTAHAEALCAYAVARAALERAVGASFSADVASKE
jgi:outer membrane protein TolC